MKFVHNCTIPTVTTILIIACSSDSWKAYKNVGGTSVNLKVIFWSTQHSLHFKVSLKCYYCHYYLCESADENPPDSSKATCFHGNLLTLKNHRPWHDQNVHYLKLLELLYMYYTRGKKFLKKYISFRYGAEKSTQTRQRWKNAGRLPYYGEWWRKRKTRRLHYICIAWFSVNETDASVFEVQVHVHVLCRQQPGIKNEKEKYAVDYFEAIKFSRIRWAWK